MPLEVQNIFNSLLEWPQRGTGSEDEMMAREQLVTHLEGEPGVDTVEEAFLAPATALPFWAVVAAGQLFAIWTASSMALIALLAGGTFFVSYFLFIDGRISPLVWLTPKKITANLVSQKGEGRRLFILMAHLDSAPASYAHRPEQIKKHIFHKYLAVGASGLGVLVATLALNDVLLPDVLLSLLSVFIFALFLFTGSAYWQDGFTAGANDNLSGVSAAVAAASRLWRRMPEDAEVRLVVTSANAGGMLGAQQYWQQHREDFNYREVYLINMDTVGAENLGFVVETGAFTPVSYNSILTRVARNLVVQNQQFTAVTPKAHRFGDFDSIWFHRGRVAALTIASYDAIGFMPHVQTVADTAEHVDLKQVGRASKFAEAIVRLVPQSRSEASQARQTRPTP